MKDELIHPDEQCSYKIVERNDLNSKLYDICLNDDIIETFNTISDAVAYITAKTNKLF